MPLCNIFCGCKDHNSEEFGRSLLNERPGVNKRHPVSLHYYESVQLTPAVSYFGKMLKRILAIVCVFCFVVQFL